MEGELRFYREDSVPHPDSIAAVLERAVGSKWKYKLADHYIANGDEQLATEVLQTLGNSFPPNSEELNLHNDFVGFIEADILPSYSDTISELDSATLQLLTSYIGTNHLITRKVMPVLALNNSLPYVIPVYFPEDDGIESETTRSPFFVEGRTDELLIYPNPSSNYTTISYKTNTVEYQLSYFVVTLEGKIMKSSVLENNQDELLLDVSQFPSGSYIILLKDGERIITSKKLSVTH